MPLLLVVVAVCYCMIHWQAQAGSLSELVEPLLGSGRLRLCETLNCICVCVVLLVVLVVARDILATGTPRPSESGWHLRLPVMYVALT